jgi:hypothetical protein
MPKAGTLDKVHLRCHRNLILTPRSCHHTPKSQKGRFRKRPKERKPFPHQPPVPAPSLQRQAPTPIHPYQVLAVRHIPHQISRPETKPPRHHISPSPKLPQEAILAVLKPFLPNQTSQNPRPMPHEKPEA